jgi:serine-type D-Ala-D-Ala carboxypeptidase (penicillin-binding protein 5/6)
MFNPLFSSRDSEVRLFAILLVALVLFFLISFVSGSKVRRSDFSVPSGSAMVPFPDVALVAKAAYVYDMRSGEVLFAKNEHIRFPIASLTKIMSALVATSLSPAYNIVTISEEALSTEGDSGLIKNEKWSLDKLLDFSLLTSSNDGMRAVALSLGALSRADLGSDEIVADFVQKMNNKASELGLEGTYYWNETGLDLPSSLGDATVHSGAYGTAKDMSSLLEYVLKNHPELLEATRESSLTFQSLDNQIHVAKNTNSLTKEIPGLLASKTGFTDTAGGNLIFAFDPELGRPIIISILGSTGQERFNDARLLISAVLEYIHSR